MATGYTSNEFGQLNTFAVEPEVYVDAENTAGWTAYAEKLNGRLAMIGFVALIATEIIGGDTLINLLFQL
ncbi:putative high light inducible protein [[Synechococcus] sp. NIES-970]|uniref:chlorophyll a/b-binding protein n=1 Tax=Picosynechococcus sp. NKBG15041c TaxID=1407650 RepID=UPI00041ECC8A|nr:chlorophyll a/b-binding protein [Picosynechococcus sp. NKBG15041c]BAW97031.1 putative high light inducible protein [[Synechococcus] sp. NIES-970]